MKPAHFLGSRANRFDPAWKSTEQKYEKKETVVVKFKGTANFGQTISINISKYEVHLPRVSEFCLH